MGWIAFVRCEKFWCDFVARTSTLIAPVQPVCTEFREVTKHCQMHPNTMRCNKTWVYGPMGWIGSVHWIKFRCDFMARTCALIALVQYVLHRVSCSNEILLNTPKHYERHTNMSLGSNKVGRVHSLRIIPKRLHGTNLRINCTCSTHFAPSFVYQRNIAKCIQILWDAPKHEFMVQWGGTGAFFAKKSDATSWQELLH